MDKKKLIGTIIGVTLFAALIAGATFAFLSFTANVTNSIYGVNTMNFLVDYTQGTHINGLPQRIGSSTRSSTASSFTDIGDVTPSNVSRLVVTAKKHNNSVDGHLSIKFTTTSSDILTTDGLVNWIICRDTNVSDAKDNTCENNFDNATNWGKISASGEIIMVNDAALANGKKGNATQTSETSSNNTYLISDTGVTYFVYFWLDSRGIANQHINKTFTGYIHSSATQIVE